MWTQEQIDDYIVDKYGKDALLKVKSGAILINDATLKQNTPSRIYKIRVFLKDKFQFGKLYFTWTLKQAEKQNVNIETKYVKGIFLWIGTHNSVDRIVGYHLKRGFIADYCYYTRNNWIKDFFRCLFDIDGFIRLTRFI